MIAILYYTLQNPPNSFKKTPNAILEYIFIVSNIAMRFKSS